MPEISIIIPFYNRIEWLKAAIQSVLKQTYQDMELIVVDDGSDTDCRAEIEKLDPRIVFLRQKKQGPACARNTGLASACGQYIAFLDSDDLFLENKLEIQINVMKANPSVLLSHTSYVVIDSQGAEISTIHSGLFTGWTYPDILVSCPIATPTVMLRREVLAYTRFDEGINIAEDILLWSRIAKGSTIIGIDQPLSKVRIHGKNAAYDYDKQLIGLNNIIRYGIRVDSELSLLRKIGLFAEIYWLFGYIYWRKKKHAKGFLFAVLAFFCGLFEAEHRFLKHKLVQLARKILPETWRKAIKQIFPLTIK